MRSADSRALASQRIETELGPLLLAATPRGIAFVALELDSAEEDLARWAARHGLARNADLAASALLARGAEELAAYARRERRSFDSPLDLRGTPFQIALWKELCAIPYGATRTYGEIAARLGRPRATRAVGGASGANPAPIFVPCHRVLAKEGLGGFSSGLDWKRRLLELEGAFLFS